MCADSSKMITGKRMPVNQGKREGTAGDFSVWGLGKQGTKSLIIALTVWVGVIYYH